jgi:hypothetical protein
MDAATRSMGRKSAAMARTAADWARICRVEAARTVHPPSRALLLQMAAEYDLVAEREKE